MIKAITSAKMDVAEQSQAKDNFAASVELTVKVSKRLLRQ